MAVQKAGSVNHYMPTGLRAAIIATGYWVLSLSLTVLSGSVASFIGCLLACYAVDIYINRPPLERLRNPTIIAAALAFALISLSLSALITGSGLLPNLLSPIASYNLSEFIKWLGISASITVSLRTLAQRTSYGAVLEILFVAAAFVITLAAHRNGMIHRPFFIGDFALTRGMDPSAILMALGCGAVVSLAGLLMIENNQRRLPYHFAMLGLLCFSLLIYVRLFGIPTPQLTDDLGLTGAEQSGSGSQRENPFRDGENDASDKEAPVAIVLFRDDYEPTGGAYYFRESAYSQFNGSMLDFTTNQSMDLDLIEHFTNTRAEINQQLPAIDKRETVTTTIGMLVAHRNPFGLDTPVAYENTPNPNNLRFKRTYNATSMVPQFEFDDLLGRETGHTDWSEEVLEEYLELPSDPRYQELAESLIVNLRPEYANDPYARALAVKTYLDENGIYSLKNDHAYAEDPAASFLFGDLTGYCMHFSFAATYMFRSLGIPARVGVGYSVPARNRAGGSSLLIQAVHGHAWPEIYFRGLGWVIVDPAPQQTLVDMTTDPQNSLQQLLGDMLRNDASFEEFLESQQTSLFPLRTLMNVLAALVLATLLTAYLVKFYRLWIPGRLGSGQEYRLVYRAVLDKLSAIGLHRNYGESREDFANRVADLTPSFKQLTDNHLACALGSEATTAAGMNMEQWKIMGQAVDKEITSNAESWKTILGLINPFSWLLTK
ncbi:MAG: transglutaminase-like domain-containing protein [Gammaproteobacteria bacterium]|jgi:transglutaminase-like putative cysteine protease|nr:hypothetical protein [Gammaproteobacteria bacterium]MDP6097532.1 transglutaminase-like domain-containing protein [Gammaproteobacteria bacterium]HJO12823.1 transglutaminase-like domain-containing protein [Gammaproteobacteria bacterium]